METFIPSEILSTNNQPKGISKLQKLDKLYYLNLNTDESMIKMLAYFDVVELYFIKVLFEVIIPDDITFSECITNRTILNTIQNSPTFKFWDKEKLLDNKSYFSNNNTIICYEVEGDIVKMIRLEKDGNVFERKYING